MDDDSAVYTDTVNLLLARIALDQGLLTEEQVEQAQAVQEEERLQGVSPVRSLGVILVENGALSSAQLVSLLRQLRDRSETRVGRPRQETLLGTLLLRRSSITPPQLAECLRFQAEARRRDEAVVPRLGELLVEKGYAPPALVSEVLAAQAEARTGV